MMNYSFLSGSLMEESGLECQRNITCLTVLYCTPSVKFGKEVMMLLGCSSGVDLGTFQ